MAVIASMLVGASPALGHAQLVETAPASQQTLTSAPKEITLRFNETVTVAFGGIKVFDPDGRRVEIDRVEVDARRIRVKLALSRTGTYAVAWRATSADSHPVRGAFTFNVSTTSSGSAAIDRAREASRRQVVLEAAFGVGRALLLMSVLCASGGMLFVSVCDPGGRIRGIGAWLGIATLSIVMCFVLDAAVTGGFTFIEAMRWSVISEQAFTGYGVTSLVRMCLVILALLAVRRSRSQLSETRSRYRIGVTVAAVLLAGSLSLSGHALSSAHRGVAIPLDMLHVTVAAAWIGGLVQLVARSRQFDQPDRLTTATIELFSRVAFGSVVLLVASGTWASWERVGLAREAWMHTSYGQLLMLKLGLFAATIPLAGLNRIRHMPRLRSGWDSEFAARRALRRYVRVESALAIGVVAVTAWLIAQQPAREAIAPEQVQKERVLRTGGQLQIVIDPARAGSNSIHIYALTPQGAPDSGVTSITAHASNEARNLDGLDLGVRRAGSGHVTSKTTIPYAGTWTILVRVERGKFSEERVRIPIRIASAGAS